MSKVRRIKSTSRITSRASDSRKGARASLLGRKRSSSRSCCWSELAAAYFGANLLAIGEVGFRRNPKLGGRFSDPLTLTALDVDASVDRVDSEGGEETVAVRAGVLDPTELGVDLSRVTLIAVGATDPFIGGRVDV